MHLDLSSLNAEQKEAVTYGEGPLLVISAAGSGKTRVLTYRAAHLIDEGVEPGDLMLCTFTRKAAQEMQQRVARLVGEVRSDGIRGGTMHSLFLRILKVESWPWPEFEILDEYGQKRMLKGILGEGGNEDIAEVMSFISLAKNELQDPEQLDNADLPARLQNLVWVYGEYEDQKREQRLIDFDDMLVETVRLFEADPTVLEHHRPGWLLVDEAQDTSTAQWRALELLAGGFVPYGEPDHSPRNITCVADWRQAIYGWRGARADEILEYGRRFPSPTVVELPTNYRSKPHIVDAANALIRHAGRDLKDMVAHRRPGRGLPPAVIRKDWFSPDDEARDIADVILENVSDGRRFGDHAILYRVNSYSRAFEQALAEAKIPYTVIGSKGFFGRKEVTDVVAYLRFIADPNDEESLRRIVNRPTRYLGRAYCDVVARSARSHGTTLRAALCTAATGRQWDAAARLSSSLDRMAAVIPTTGIPGAIRYLREAVGYDRWLLHDEGSGTVDENRLENLNELAEIASRFSSLTDFLAFVDMQLAKSKSDDPDPDKVQLMSIHRSKGLEWPVVFAVGFSEGIIPHARCMEGPALEEERRLAYVAITRAADEIHLSTVEEWQTRVLMPSRFLREAGVLQEAIV